MTNVVAIKFIETEISRLWDTPQCRLYKEALEMAIKALEQKPETVTEFADRCRECGKMRKGHWVKTIGENGITSAVRCSECGFEDNRYMLFRYCPNCSAKME